MRIRSLFVGVVFLCSSAVPGLAWDDRGHALVAQVAAHYLTPAARKEVDAILKTDADPMAPHDIAAAATWADRFRDGKSLLQYEATINWHYASIYANRPNIPEACFGHTGLPPGTLASKGPANACVIDKIDQFRDELADRSTPARERLLALKYLLHLVGDIHAPLHVADMHNQFGKVIQVVAADGSVTPGTLFGYWDTALVRRLGSQQDEVAKELIAKISAEDADLWSGQVPHIWALEAHQVGTDFAYGTMLGRFEDGHFVISAADLDRGKNIVGTQISKAGIRLAGLLNDALAAKPTKAAAKASPGDPAPGRAIAEAMCTVCHMVDKRGAKGPTLTTAPDFASIANTARMSPTVLRSFLVGAHPTMPDMKLSQEQMRQVSAYIMSLRD
jgi:mono/diheme cytochrome c family protein